MTSPIAGLHHLTAVTAVPQANIDFYAGLLGQRLVKKTVNFDDPSAYHLYYGDEVGSPGTAVTFFHWPGATKGRVGAGQPTAVALSVGPESIGFWEDRLLRNGVAARRTSRFGEASLLLADPDGLPVELVAAAADGRLGWTGGGVAAEHAVRGMHTVELSVSRAGPTEELLVEPLGFALVGREAGRARFQAGPGGAGRCVDVVAEPGAPRGVGGAGTVHHIAFRVATDEQELEMRERLLRAGYRVSEVRDRDYFHSIYFQERGGILLEIATDGPGFAVDEPREGLGGSLRLPKRFEPHRSRIEEALPPIGPARRYV